MAEAIGPPIAILGDSGDTLDAVQGAGIDAYQARARLDLTRRFYPWFYVILRNRLFQAGP